MRGHEIVLLQRDVHALMVPAGARIMLHKGTEVMITQELGDSFTVEVYSNLARIDGKDADALGKEPPDPLADVPEDASLEDKTWLVMKKVYDPEIPVNVVDLGLIYDCRIKDHDDSGHLIEIDMTLTAPGCGMGPVIAEDIRSKVLQIPNVTEVRVDVVFDPPWDREMMSEEARLELGMI